MYLEAGSTPSFLWHQAIMSEASPERKSRHRVLIVEDDSFSMAYFQSSLEIIGYEILTAESVSEAKKVIMASGAETISLVLSDFRMPQESGLDLLRWLVRHDPTLSCVIVTAEGEKDVVKDSLAMGAAGYLDKPVAIPALSEAIKKGIELTEKRRQLNATQNEVQEASELSSLFHSLASPEIAKRLQIHFQPLRVIGGDFVNVIALSASRHAIFVGDVSGHNVKAGFVSAYFQGLARGLMEEGVCAGDIFQKFDRLLVAEWGGGEEQSITQVPISLAAGMAVIDEDAGDVEYLNCGLPLVAVYQSEEGRFDSLPGFGPLGWGMRDNYNTRKHAVEGYDLLILASDGLTDLADHLEVNPVALVYQTLTKGRVASSLNVERRDDLLIVILQMSPADSKQPQFRPVIHEQYAGSELDQIDRLQKIWRRSLQYALEKNAGSRLYDLLLCCREAVLNAMTHGCEGSHEKICTLNVSYAEEKGIVRVRVDDPGRGHAFDLEERLAKLDLMEGSHLGLGLISNLSDRLETENAGSSLLFDFQLTALPEESKK